MYTKLLELTGASPKLYSKSGVWTFKADDTCLFARSLPKHQAAELETISASFAQKSVVSVVGVCHLHLREAGF